VPTTSMRYNLSLAAYQLSIPAESEEIKVLA